jgi:hypothetical protein
MKLYVVKIAKGYYEDADHIIIGIYDSEEQANKAIESYTIQMGILQSKYSEEQIEQLQKKLDEAEAENWTPEQHDFYQWYYTDEIQDYHLTPWIQEIELNKEFNIKDLIN